MRIVKILMGVLILMTTACATNRPPADTTLTLRPDAVENPVDVGIYGHFLEHIYQSVHGGLWNELVRNRGFEVSPPNTPVWVREGDGISQMEYVTHSFLRFGDESWVDYEMTVQGRKLHGMEGFLLAFRARPDGTYYWANFGGWGNRHHGIEKGHTPELRTLLARNDGAIIDGQWYDLGIRCEGNTFSAWVNGEKWVEVTDDDNPNMSGAVGLGSWVTAVQFRNVRVTSLDGEVLFEGLPDVGGLDQLPMPSAWLHEGPGRASRVAREALREEYCLRAVSKSGGLRIMQPSVYLADGMQYEGSLWMKGTAPDGAIARITDHDGFTLASCELPAPGDDWSEIPVRLAMSRQAQSGRFVLEFNGRCDVLLDQVIIAPTDARTPFRSDLVEALDGLQAPFIRWPGGCYAERYQWKDGVGPQIDRGKFPIRLWEDFDPNSFGTDEFIALCRELGTEPVIVINTGRHDPTTPREEYIREAQQWVEYCNGPATSEWGARRAANGHPEPYDVKYWEIDNEAWPATPEVYVELVKAFAPALEEVDPSITLIACGSGGFDDGVPSDGWNQVLLDGCAEYFDYLSVHHYESPPNYATGPARYGAFLGDIADMIAASSNPDIKLFVSEWNLMTTDWTTGIYAAGILNEFERRGDTIAWASPALLVREWPPADWDNAFINFTHEGWFPAPNYVAMKLWREHYSPQRIAVEGETNGLNVIGTRSEDGKRIVFKAVNTSDSARSIDLSIEGAPAVDSAAYHLIAPGVLSVRNTIEQPDRVRPVTTRLDARLPLRVDMPALSAGVVVVELE